eukprot:PITA_21287
MEKFFDYEELEDEKKVKFAVTKLKGHATLWWDGVQAERRRLGKQPIKNWSRMVAKLKGKFLPSNYQQTLFRQMQNLRQRALTVKEYTEEFYKFTVSKNSRGSLSDSTEGRRKNMRKQSARGRGTFREKESQGGSGRSTTPAEGASNSSTQHASTGGDARGRGSFSRGRGGRGGGREVRCYRCNKLGHRAFECPESVEIKQRNAIVAPAEEEVPVAAVTEEVDTPESGVSGT